MKKLFTIATVIIAFTVALALPSYASENATETAEAVEPTVTAEAEEITAEANVEATEATTEEQTAVVPIEDGYNAEQDRDWLINAIKAAKPEEVEFIKGYIEDALVAMEGLNYTDWEWAYKIVADNAEWFACVIVGLGFVFAGVVAIVKYRREKLLINNSVSAVGVAEGKMAEMVKRMDAYETAVVNVTTNVTKALEYMQARDDELEAEMKELAKRDETVIAASNNAVNAKLLLADVLGEMIQLSNIPQIRKDEIYTKHETAKNHILNEMMGGDNNEESEG